MMENGKQRGLGRTLNDLGPTTSPIDPVTVGTRLKPGNDGLPQDSITTKAAYAAYQISKILDGLPDSQWDHVFAFLKTAGLVPSERRGWFGNK